MWPCGKCGEPIEDAFDACWKCGTTRAGREAEPSPPASNATLRCLRCHRDLEYVGRKQLQGESWGLYGGIVDLLLGRQFVHVYVCPTCGRVELFVDGIGEALRHQPPGEE